MKSCNPAIKEKTNLEGSLCDNQLFKCWTTMGVNLSSKAILKYACILRNYVILRNKLITNTELKRNIIIRNINIMGLEDYHVKI